MRSRMSVRVIAALTAVLGTAFWIACSEATGSLPTKFHTALNGGNEVPALTVPASGQATVALSGSSLTYSVTVSGLSGPATAAHIHIGAPGTSGSVRFNFCGTTNTPACNAATSGTLVSATGADLAGVTMDSLLSAIRAGNAYVNVHTAVNAGGEIRGWLFRDPL